MISNSNSLLQYSNNDLVFSTGNFHQYIKNVAKIKLLTEEEEKSLSLNYYEHKDYQAAEKLIVSHLPLVLKIAYSYKGYGISVEDLVSEGNIGLMKAVSKFDPYKGFRLSTYAMWWIKSYIIDFILNSYSVVKIGTTAARKKLFFSLNKIKKKIGITGNDMSNSDAIMIANETGTSKQDVIEIDKMISSKDYSLNKTISSESSTEMGDLIEIEDLNPEEKAISNQEDTNIKNLIKGALFALKEREKVIVIERHLSETPKSLQELSEQFNISRERVRQIETAAFKKMKLFLSEKTSEF